MLIDDNEDNKDVERHGYIRQMIIGVRLGLLLAPTGALIVTVVYYTSIMVRKPLFEISSISANIFSFSFCELNAD